MSSDIRNIPVNPDLSAQKCREMIGRIRTVRQGAVAEAWITANRVITREEREELMSLLGPAIRQAFQREIDDLKGA